MKNLSKKSWYKLFGFIGIGAVLGYSYYYFIGCNTGTCPITSNPWSSVIYGSVVGLIMGLPNKKDKKENEDNQADRD